MTDAIAEAARRSPYRTGPDLSQLADRDELKFRDEIEPFSDPEREIPEWIERKELVTKLEWNLARAGIEPAGTIVELGAGACWLGAVLARAPEVDRVIGIEFSRRRLEQLAPVAIAHLGAPPEKVERVLADFYDPGVEQGSADLVIMDAAFHHAPDPVRLAGVAHSLLRPGGRFVLHREPTLALLRRTRDHGIEDEHGDFEREYDRWVYLRFLREAGFEARSYPAAVGVSSRRARAYIRFPFKLLNGVAFANYTYVGVKPGG